MKEHPLISSLPRSGFSLIEVILALGIFLVTVLALVGLIGPTLKSVNEVEKTDEVVSVVHTVNAYLQSSPDIETQTDSKFNVIFNAVAEGGEATLFVFSSYLNATSTDVELKVGFSRTEPVDSKAKLASSDFINAAGNIYRVVMTPSSVNPAAMLSDLGEGNYPRYALAVTNPELFTEGAFAMEVRIFEEEPGVNFSELKTVRSLALIDPLFTYNTAIVR